MTRQEIKAIRHLPRRFIRDGTQVWTVNNFVVAINPALLPVILKNGIWEQLKIPTQMKP